jgi:hypothetical protein
MPFIQIKAYNLKLCMLSLKTLIFAATGAKSILFQSLVNSYILRLVLLVNFMFFYTKLLAFWSTK